MRGHHLLFVGDLDEAVGWYRLAVAAPDDAPTSMMAAGSAAMALGYAGDPGAGAQADDAIALVGDGATPFAAYVWYCAGEALLETDTELARARLVRALELAEQTHSAFVVGVAGASKASIDARTGDPVTAAAEYRRLILHWRRAGMWSTQWTMLRSIAGLLARLGRFHDAAVLEGAVRSTVAGHRIFGTDQVALAELTNRLRAELGATAYEAARAQGAVLDGAAAVEHALRSL
jgi:hypothetical protein